MRTKIVPPHMSFIVALLFWFVPLFSSAQSAPLATTLGPTVITEKSAQLNCRINPGGATNNQYWFEWAIGGGIYYETQRTRTGDSFVEVRTDLIGLAPNTLYYYRCVSENDRGKDVGQVTAFSTKQLPVTTDPYIIVRTLDVTNISETGAKAKGYASPHGTSNSVVWFEYGEGGSFGRETARMYQSGYSAYYEATLTNLSSGTTYQIRAVGENAGGRTVGDTKTFSTKAATAVSPAGTNTQLGGATTGSTLATPVNPTTPKINMEGIVDTLSAIPTDYGADFLMQWNTPYQTNGTAFFEYGETRSFGKRTRPIPVSATGVLRTPENLFSPNTTYYYRGVFQYGDNSTNQLRGNTESVRTPASVPNASPTVTRSSGLTTLGGGTVAPGGSGSSISTAANTTATGQAGPSLVPIVGGVTTGTQAGSVQPGVIGGIRTNGSGAPGTQSGIGAQNNPFAISNPNNPFSYFSNLFGFGKEASSTRSSTTATGELPSKTKNSNASTPSGQLAGVATSGGIWQKFWNDITGKNDLTVRVASNEPNSPHQTVEYNVLIENLGERTYNDAVLKVVFPSNVIYVGDDTNNEFMVLDQDGGGERTYVLNLGAIPPGEKKTVTMLGVLTSDLTVSPNPRVRVEHKSGSGEVVVVGAKSFSQKEFYAETKVGRAQAQVGAASGSGILPDTFFEWIMFFILTALVIIGYIKGRAYYLARKKELEEDSLKEEQVRVA